MSTLPSIQALSNSVINYTHKCLGLEKKLCGYLDIHTSPTTKGGFYKKLQFLKVIFLTNLRSSKALLVKNGLRRITLSAGFPPDLIGDFTAR